MRRADRSDSPWGAATGDAVRAGSAPRSPRLAARSGAARAPEAEDSLAARAVTDRPGRARRARHGARPGRGRRGCLGGRRGPARRLRVEPSAASLQAPRRTGGAEPAGRIVILARTPRGEVARRIVRRSRAARDPGELVAGVANHAPLATRASSSPAPSVTRRSRPGESSASRVSRHRRSRAGRGPGGLVAGVAGHAPLATRASRRRARRRAAGHAPLTARASSSPASPVTGRS